MHDYGYGNVLNDSIRKDGIIMAQLVRDGIVTIEQVRSKSSELDEAFYAAGGSDAHSGFSFGAVCGTAHNILEGHWDAEGRPFEVEEA